MLAGQSTTSSTLASSPPPALADATLRSGRRRGLSQLYNHLIHSHHAHSPALITQESSASSLTPVRPRPSRAQTSPSPTTSPSPSPQPAVSDPDAVPTAQPLRTDSATRTRAQSASRRPRMLPIVNTQPLREAHSSRSAEPTPAGDLASLLNTTAPLAPSTSQSAGSLPSIQFIPASDPSRARPSLDFRRITRVLPSTSSVIRVGRYSERDSAVDPNPSAPSDAPIGFKSKVVSRRHCEFFCSAGQWYIKDVKSSSGTFLNHIRLSQPGIESKPFPINDGDTVQLGIDFKGGEEMIFRCVKIRIETNRGWQRGLNKFNKSTHKQLQALAKGRKKDSDAASKYSTDCTICLNSIAPCQALFIAPCSHTWHFKCIRQILEQSTSGQFLCPNCRALADLDADVDENLEDFEEYEESDMEMDEESDLQQGEESNPTREGNGSPTHSSESDAEAVNSLSNVMTAAPTTETRSTGQLPTVSPSPALSLDDAINRLGLGETEAFQASPTGDPIPTFSLSSPRAIPGSSMANGVGSLRARTGTVGSDLSEGLSDVNSLGPSSPGRNALEGFSREGPMTPRNTAGPFVFDGRADANEIAANSSSDEARRH